MTKHETTVFYRPYLWIFLCVCFILVFSLHSQLLRADNTDKIVFTAKSPNGNTNIYSVNADGSALTRLTETGNNTSPRWSPDGKQIVFTSDRDDSLQSQIYIMDADGSNQIRLTGTGFHYFPAWSPDGQQIVFCDDYEIQVISRDDSKWKRFTDFDVGIGYPAWSPDGEWIAFTAHLGENEHFVYVMKKDGSSLTNVDKLDRYVEDYVAWSPDSNWLLFTSLPSVVAGGHYQVFKVNVNGTGFTRITSQGHNTSPSFSSDGKRILFSSSRGGWQVYTIDADGTNETQLTHSGSNHSPVWSPDNAYIAFVSSRNGNGQIFRMNADGTEQTPLTPSEIDVIDVGPIWQVLSRGANQ